jgi:two-component system response regulator NreC
VPLRLQSASTPGPAGRTTPAAQPIRVVIADDHQLTRRELRLLLDTKSDMEVIAEAEDIASVAHHVGSEQPEVLVLDLDMPGSSSIEAISSLHKRAPDTQIVVLTAEESPVFAQLTFAAGAIAFVTKERAGSELPAAVHAAAQGEQYISPRVAARMEALRSSLEEDRLTAREVEVLRLIALGHTSAEIAEKLHLSPRTVEMHRANIHRKLGLATRAELVHYALRRGLLG